MAFLPLIPQATDALSISQGNILNNFTILGAIAGNSNASSASLNNNSGFNWIFLPTQGSAPGNTPPPAAAFPAGSIGLYSALNPVTGQNDLYVNKTNQTTVVQVPTTSSILSVNATPPLAFAGWTYLPSGLLLKWGSGLGNGYSTFTFVATNPGSPAFAQVLAMFVCPFYSNTADGDGFCRLGDYTNLDFNVFCSARTTVTTKSVTFQFLAIGY